MTGSDTPRGPEQVLRGHARTILVALEEAAQACVERASRACDDCVDSDHQWCDSHADHLAHADACHRVLDELTAVLGPRRAAQRDLVARPGGPYLRLVHSAVRRPDDSSLGL